MDKNIVILGAGFGGLKAAIYLGKQKKRGRLPEHRIILIDRNDYHTYTPTLYEISTTSKEVANYLQLEGINSFPIAKLISGLPVTFREAEVVRIDTENGDVHLASDQKIPYDHLIIALGSETNHFNIPGLKEHAHELKTFVGAVGLRDAVWELIEGADPDDDVNIMIGGGGPTGVELAGELQEWITQLKKEGYNCRTSVTLIESGETVLARFGPRIVKRATRRLEKLGTNLVTGEFISRIDKENVHLKGLPTARGSSGQAGGKKIPYDIFVWTGGVKANKLAASLPLKFEKGERLEVGSELLCVAGKSDLTIRGNVYAIGDITCLHDEKTGAEVPGVARAAIGQATVASKNIIRDIEIKPHVRFKPWDYPYITPVGGKYAIAKVGPFVISGFFGWVLKGLVELNYLFSIMPTGIALKTWIRGLRIFIQNDRLG